MAPAFVVALDVVDNRVEGEVVASTHSRPDGRFALTVPRPGAYLIIATSEQGCGFTEIVAGPGADSSRVELRAATMEVAGSVTSTVGTVPPGVVVRAVSFDESRDVCVSRVGRSGKFRFALPRAHYLLTAHAPGYEYVVKQVADTGVAHARLAVKPLEQLPEVSEVTEWVREYGLPIATDDPRAEYDDLRRLGEGLANTRIVAMGEATHGTREFFRLKHRFFRYLVEQHGFRVFAIETGWPEALAIDEYVAKGVGDPREALAAGHYWTWDTEEVLDLIEWMRSFNRELAGDEDRLRFVGFDMVFTDRAASAVSHYLLEVDPRLQQELQQLFDVFGNAKRPDVAELRRSRSVTFAAQLERVRVRIAESDPSQERTVALHHVDVLAQAEEMYRLDGVPSTVARDRAMAANIEWILEQSGAVSFDEASWDIPAMGSYLRKRYGDDLLAVGFVFGGGKYRAYDARDSGGPVDTVRPFEVGTPRVDSIDHALRAAGVPLLWIDMRTAVGAIRSWFNARHPTRTSSVIYKSERSLYSRLAPARHFDVLLYVDEMTPSTPTATGVRPRPERD